MENLDLQKEQKPSGELVEPTVKYKDSFIEAVKEFQVEGRNVSYDIEKLQQDFDSFVQKNKDRSDQFPDSFVPESVFWLIDHNDFIGTTRVRRELNDELRKKGGNIGYEIRPSKRRQGYGNLILELALEKARQVGLSEALLTCDDDNVGSYKIIEANGGTLIDKIDRDGTLIRRYLIKIK